MSDWKPYFGDRLIRENPAGFVVIVPVNREPPIPVCCPVCQMMMVTSDDAEYFRTKQCCRPCGLRWADRDLENWVAGWRPTSNDVQEEVSRRQAMPVYLNLESLK